MKQIEKRLRVLESAAEVARPEEPTSDKWSITRTAIAIAFALRLGGNAREELDVADASLNPGRRAVDCLGSREIQPAQRNATECSGDHSGELGRSAGGGILESE